MRVEGMVNVGQLVRERHGRENCVLVGFGTYAGSVLAGESWDAPVEVMKVPPARSGSLEALLHAESPQDRLLIFNDGDERFRRVWPHRAIGVVYHPERERYGNYVPTVPAERYDAFIYLDQTTALDRLDWV
jgi:erythromycin esterase-like protein